MLHYQQLGKISLQQIARKMSHAVADCFQIANRGYIREGYFADLVMVDTNTSTEVTQNNIFYKCGWSPLENFRFPASIEKTMVNGRLVWNQGQFDETVKGQRLAFDR